MNKTADYATYYFYCLTQGLGRFTDVGMEIMFSGGGTNLRQPHKSPTVFALYQSIAHEFITFFSKVGMFYIPNSIFRGFVPLYEDFALSDFISLMEPKGLKHDDNDKIVCNIPCIFAIVVVGMIEGYFVPHINGIGYQTPNWQSLIYSSPEEQNEDETDEEEEEEDEDPNDNTNKKKKKKKKKAKKNTTPKSKKKVKIHFARSTWKTC